MSKPNPSVITSASNPVLEGPDRRAALKLLKNYSESSARINLLKVLISEGFGLQEVEKFSLDIQRKFRSKKFKNSYWPNFDETLKVGSWEHLEQIPIVMMTFVKATVVLATLVHIRNISTVIDTIWTNKSSRQGKGKIRAKSIHAVCNVKARLGQCQGKEKAMIWQW